MYWLVNSGTREDPWLEDILERYRVWNAENGDVQMFPFRPARMTVGDILIHRIVGSPDSELVAVGEVTSSPHPSGNERWPWQASRRLLHVRNALPDAPTAQSAGIVAKGMRVMKKLSNEDGRLAVSLIVAAGRPYAPDVE